MSLVVQIGINGAPPIALVSARRTSGSDDEDALNTYAVQHFDLRGHTVRQLGDTAEIVHRYGDGAVALAQAALTAALTMK